MRVLAAWERSGIMGEELSEERDTESHRASEIVIRNS